MRVLIFSVLVFFVASVLAEEYDFIRPGDKGEPVSLDVNNEDIKKVIQSIKKQSGVNLGLSYKLSGNITINEANVSWLKAVEIILDKYDYHLLPRRYGYIVSGRSYEEHKRMEDQKEERKKNSKSAAELWEEERVKINQFLNGRERSRNEKEKKALKKRKEKARLREYCNDLRDKVMQHERERHIWYKLDKHGGRVFLTKKEINITYKNLQSTFKKNCS
ncbi:MAG: hypothetical protein JKX92_14590 [Porticoccaceae bacterium]|nr:hypothetical protein [Porticoccaceae bacterium]